MPFPAGERIDDGFSTLIKLSNAPTISFWEKEVTPPGMDGGGPVPTDTMRNVEWRTLNSKHLISMTPMTMVVAYSTGVLDDIQNNLNKPQIVFTYFPDGRSWSFWGYLAKFTANALREGEQPTATIEIQPTNQNLSGTETAPTIGIIPGQSLPALAGWWVADAVSLFDDSDGFDQYDGGGFIRCWRSKNDPGGLYGQTGATVDAPSVVPSSVTGLYEVSGNGPVNFQSLGLSTQLVFGNSSADFCITAIVNIDATNPLLWLLGYTGDPSFLGSVFFDGTNLTIANDAGVSETKVYTPVTGLCAIRIRRESGTRYFAIASVGFTSTETSEAGAGGFSNSAEMTIARLLESDSGESEASSVIEMILQTANQTTIERAAMNAYILDKYGLTLPP